MVYIASSRQARATYKQTLSQTTTTKKDFIETVTIHETSKMKNDAARWGLTDCLAHRGKVAKLDEIPSGYLYKLPPFPHTPQTLGTGWMFAE